MIAVSPIGAAESFKAALQQIEALFSDAQRVEEVWKTYRESRLRRDRDGVWFLNFFCELGSFSRQGGWSNNHPLYRQGMELFEIIQGLVTDTVDQPHVYEKLSWLALFWNEEVGRGFARFIQPVLPRVILAGDEPPKQTWPIPGGISPGIDGLEE